MGKVPDNANALEAAVAAAAAVSAATLNKFSDDAGPSAAEQLLTQFSDSLSSSFPLPFRILVLCTLGLSCWAVNLHVLHLLGIDTSKILDIRHATSNEHLHPSRLYQPIYQLAAFYAAWTGLCWTVGFKWLADGQGDSEAGRWVAGFSWVTALLFLVAPFDKLKRTERLMFLRSLKRAAMDSITRPVAFCDVILADILTSFAKVLGDVWVCVCSILGMEDEAAGFKDLGVPFMIALPYMFRFKQCLAEYYNTPWDAPTPSGGSTSPYQSIHQHQHHHHHGHGHQHSIFLGPTSSAITPASPKKRSLFNALKYASAFPVIFFSALQNKHGDVYHHPAAVQAQELQEGGPGGLGVAGYFTSTTLFNIWVLAVLFNSAFSFWWDITNDWGLHLLLPSRIYRKGHDLGGVSGNATILRRTMLLPDPMIYYLCIALDLILRLTWSLKLSSHLHAVHEIEMGIFTLEALEVVRRWIWVFLRVEWEAVRKGGDSLEDRLAVARNNPSGPSSALSSPNASNAALNLSGAFDNFDTGGSGFLPAPHGPQSQQIPLQTGGGGTKGSSLDRRVSSGSRKHAISNAPFSDDDPDSKSDFGMGRSGVLVDVPKITVGVVGHGHSGSASSKKDKP